MDGKVLEYPEEIAPDTTRAAPPTDRVKTHKKDAELLAQLLAESLTAVDVPLPAFEGARDVDARPRRVPRDLMDARHRVSKLLLRHGRVYPDSSTWTVRHRG